jgi:hypothetical protein
MSQIVDFRGVEFWWSELDIFRALSSAVQTYKPSTESWHLLVMLSPDAAARAQRRFVLVAASHPLDATQQSANPSDRRKRKMSQRELEDSMRNALGTPDGWRPRAGAVRQQLRLRCSGERPETRFTKDANCACGSDHSRTHRCKVDEESEYDDEGQPVYNNPTARESAQPDISDDDTEEYDSSKALEAMECKLSALQEENRKLKQERDSFAHLRAQIRELDAQVQFERNVTERRAKCAICLHKVSNRLVRPCNHLCMCERCARTLLLLDDDEQKRCPICRDEFSGIDDAFIA